MGRKLDLSGLTDSEAEHVLQVVQRDMRLRKKEEFRLSELRQELDEEGSRCLLLSRQSCFNQRCCIRCCSPFTFLLNPKRQCRDCRYNVCKACRVYSKRDKAWLCSACQKSRLLKAQSLEWFYADVKKRFKRFGSAKVLKTLYRKHLAEHGALSELTEGSAYEESICNEGSVCGSDSTFYRQTEEHSMAETLAVALRVAEEAVDEAISKAEFDTASQEKQNEAHYLREHRGELIEELAKTIVQKIISRRKTLADMRAEYDQDWPLEHSADLKHRHRQSACDPACRGQPGLWRSQSAFSLLDSDGAGLLQDSPQALHKEGGGSAMSSWKSVDRLDNAVLKSPDGNWIALQSAQLSRPSLLTQRKSLVYSALERESGVVSAYEGMGSDNDTKPEPDSSWGAALQEIHRKMADSNSNPPTGRRGSRDDLFSHSEPSKPLLALHKRQVPAGIRRPSSSPRTSIIDVNFNVEGAGDEEQSEVAAEPAVGKVRRSQKKRKSRKQSPVMHSNKDLHPQQSSDGVTPETLTSGATTPEPFDPESDITGLSGANQMDQELTSKLQQPAGRVSDSSTGGGGGGVDGVRDAGNDGQMEERRRGREDGGEEEERLWRMEIDLDEGGTEEEEDEELNCRLHRFFAQSRLASFSSTDDELDRVGQSGAEVEAGEDGDKQEENKDTTDGLTYKLCQLEKEVRASQFSSTEDELDRAGVVDEVEEDEEDGDLAVKVSRLANQVSATQFSSTEDELDRAGRVEAAEEEEEAIDEETQWKLQAEKAVQAAQLRDLTSLVGASQFPSTEDHLDGAGEDDGATEPEVNEGGSEGGLWEEAQGKNQERRESLGDLDVKMFDLRDETEDRKKDSGVSDGQTKDVQHDKVGEKKDCMEQDERMVKRHEGEVLKERTEEKIALHETNVQQENQPETQWPAEKDREERQEEEEISGSKESQGTWETAAEDSDEEDKEFDRIISSMLMLTLEDMQGETLKDEAAENDGREKERGDAAELQERDTDPQDKMNLAKEKPAAMTTEETLETNESKRTCQSPEEDRLGSVRTEGQMTEAQGDEDEEQSSASSLQERLLSPEEIHIGSDMELYKTVHFISTLLEQRYSAVSLCSITTEVLKVLNATEELLQGVEGGGDPRPSSTSLPSNTDPKKLDQQFSRLEENVYVAAGAVYTLEAELGDLEECARDVCSATSDMELSFLEEQVASAAAKVQQTELQICDISARIAALKSAGLNVDAQSRLTKTRAVPLMPVTLDSSRQQRRRLPAPPVTEDKES